jgi:hypothetical protein
MMEYEILTRSLKDSAAHSKLKLLKEGETFGVEKPGGEKRIHIGSMSEEKEWDNFFFPNGVFTFNANVSKMDLVKYMLEAKNEYLKPHQSYRLNISDFYDTLYKQTLEIPNESFQICFEKNVDDRRYYLTRPSNNSLSSNYQYIIEICLPIVTKYVFLRVKDENSYTYYLKPEFKPDFIPNSDLNKNDSISKAPLLQNFFNSPTKDKYLPYFTALRTKPFMLLAGISGTGKSRIVRELAKACWKDGDEEYGKNNPRNFCMVQVKPNWHDSTELFGYVSRISGKPKFVAGDFLKFVVKAWEEPNVPYFLCLDEMNLAPVEQYFAEYLSVIESRKSADGIITTDPLFKKPFEDRVYDINIKYGDEIDWYQQLVIQLTSNEDLQQQFYKEGITIPKNLFVVGTVNMDETTFSFSRKVLDRAMTIEMNEVDLYGGLDKEGSEIGYIGNCIIGTAAEGKDVYAENKELCNQVIAYLEKVNNVLDKTPFKIAYRTRNEFLLYAVNRQLLDKDSQLWQTLDEMTSMKILSRIEGDSERTKSVLEGLKVLVEEIINKAIPEPEEGKEKLKSITDTKIEEMLKKLRDSGYTSYWA